MTTKIKPDQVIEIIIRRIWLLILPLCVTLTLGVILTLTANRTYVASTSILVQPQRVPREYIQSIVSSDINQRISTISQQILSRTNLEKIIDEFGLFTDKDNMYLEDKVRSLRRRVRVRIERARHGAEAFSVSFEGDEPERVMKIANTIATYFMDENLKVREAQAVGTSEFLESELLKTRSKLEEREKILSEYRTKHLGGLPDELETNLRTLDRLQLQLTERQTVLRDIKSLSSEYEAELNRLHEERAARGLPPSGSTDATEQLVESENEQKLSRANEELNNLLLKYTDKHPDVKKFKKIIANLEKSIEEEQQKPPEESTVASSQQNQDSPESQANPLVRLEQQLSAHKREMNNVESDIQRIKREMSVYQTRVEETPNRELELQSLQRDYNNIRNIYNSLLDRKLEAEIAVNMERKQKGEQFRILDHARLPEKPIKPDVRIIFLISIAAGIGFGGGVVFLLEYLDTSIRREDEIESEIGLPILATIPALEFNTRKFIKYLKGAFFLLISGYLAAVFLFFVVLNLKGIDKTLLFIKTLGTN